ncbi:MAG: hypothetical protein ABJZ80_11855 [Gilvibacter sp.]
METFIVFLKDWLTHLQIATALVGTYFAIVRPSKKLVLFVGFFWYACLNEFFAAYYGTSIQPGHNSIVFNIYYLFFFGILFYYLESVLINKLAKRLTRVMFAVYLFLLVFETMVLGLDYFIDFQVIPYIVAGTYIIIGVLFYFVEQLKSRQVTRIENKIQFWILTAYFFYLLALVPLKVGRNYYANQDGLSHLFNVLYIMTLVMNIVLITGFIWTGLKRET